MRRVFTVLFLVVAQIMILNPGVSGEKVQQENLHLAKEKVQWMAWGDEAFHRAEGEDKLILLDLTAVWCYMEIPGISFPDELSFDNRILFNEFDDQQNVIQISGPNREKGYLVLTESKPIASVNF